MIAATNHPYRIARVCCSPSARRLSKAGQSASSPGCPATRIIDDQTYDGRAGGASRRFGARGCDRHAPAHRQGRVHVGSVGPARLLLLLSPVPFDTRTTTLAGRFGARSFSQALSQIDGIGRRANAILAAVIQNGRQGTFQRLAKGPHRHSSVPFRKSGSDEDNRRAEGFGRVRTEYGAQRNVFVG